MVILDRGSVVAMEAGEAAFPTVAARECARPRSPSRSPGAGSPTCPRRSCRSSPSVRQVAAGPCATRDSSPDVAACRRFVGMKVGTRGSTSAHRPIETPVRRADRLPRSGPRRPNGAALNDEGPGQTTFASPAGAAPSRQLPRRDGTRVARENSRTRAANRASSRRVIRN